MTRHTNRALVPIQHLIFCPPASPDAAHDHGARQQVKQAESRYVVVRKYTTEHQGPYEVLRKRWCIFAMISWLLLPAESRAVPRCTPLLCVGPSPSRELGHALGWVSEGSQAKRQAKRQAKGQALEAGGSESQSVSIYTTARPGPSIGANWYPCRQGQVLLSLFGGGFELAFGNSLGC